ncbi:PQQ-binding-like beta-propeller repeat protein [Streptosporangium sp. NPDC006013]|uniref:outer membrane protein assembly factor BamB family protein n=1 Tax=Streptosporangium sp. NPDC006013 TaxID=3155596 RepID=UPI0033BEF3BD
MIGKTLWERQLHQRGSASALAVTEDRVVLHERHTRLVCLDRHDCSVRWDVPIGTWPRAVVVAGDRCLVLPQDIDQLFCLDLTTGSVVWRAGLPQYSGHVVATAETVVVGGWRGYTPMSAFDLKDGRSLWRTRRRMATVLPLPQYFGRASDVRHPVRGGASAEVRCPASGCLWALPPRTRTARAATRVSRNRRSRPPVR